MDTLTQVQITLIARDKKGKAIQNGTLTGSDPVLLGSALAHLAKCSNCVGLVFTSTSRAKSGAVHYKSGIFTKENHVVTVENALIILTDEPALYASN